MDRRSLHDNDEARSERNVDVFDDSFEVDEDMDMVADGFRPGHDHDREAAERQEAGPSTSSTRTTSQHYAPATSSAGPSRSSTRKSRGQDNPFTSPEDRDAEPLLHRTPSGNYTPLPHRSISSASSNRFARTHSLRIGAGGPSHPYGMYPQGTIARTPSVTTTTSTARPQQSTTSSGGPQHPYALYPQGIGDDLDDEGDALQAQVPMGFLGLGQSFHRQRGPDGEEQDIVGFYGHTEQLPPYTRYPEDGPEKPLLSTPDPPAASHSHAPVQGTDPSMPLMHAHVEPVRQQSMTEQSELIRQPSVQSNTSVSVAATSPEQSVTSSQKMWSEKTWGEKRKTRVCGVPCWWSFIAVGILVFILVVTGGAVGGFVAGQEKAKQHYYNPVTTTGYDASVISTPTSAPPIPTGTYSLNFGPAHATDAACLPIVQQRPAWDCNLVYGNEVSIHVTTSHNDDQSGAYFDFNRSGDEGGLTYGSQASQLTTSFSPFTWVQDKDDTESGATLYFKTQYDKIVVVPEMALDLGTKKIKRDYDHGVFQSQVAGPSSRPWYCFWNETMLEGFIYIHDKVAELPPYMQSTTPSTPYSTPAWATSMTAAPSQTITTTITMPSTTATYTGAASKFPKWLYQSYPDFNYTAYTATRDPNNQKRADDASNIYPYRVKLEERRTRGAPLPYCIQYQVLNDGVVNWIPNDAGQQIVVQLAEKNPPFKPLLYPPGDSRKLRQKRDDNDGSCHCQYISQ